LLCSLFLGVVVAQPFVPILPTSMSFDECTYTLTIKTGEVTVTGSGECLYDGNDSISAISGSWQNAGSVQYFGASIVYGSMNFSQCIATVGNCSSFFSNVTQKLNVAFFVGYSGPDGFPDDCNVTSKGPASTTPFFKWQPPFGSSKFAGYAVIDGQNCSVWNWPFAYAPGLVAKVSGYFDTSSTPVQYIIRYADNSTSSLRLDGVYVPFISPTDATLFSDGLKLCSL